MALDSLEDRICAQGRHDEFARAVAQFENSNRQRADEQVFYDELTNLGASPEEADEYVNLFTDQGSDW